jgi:hypothetical protein
MPCKRLRHWLFGKRIATGTGLSSAFLSPSGKTRLLLTRRIGITDEPRSHFSSFVTLQISLVCPVFESITVVRGRQLQVTLFAFSCLTTTQCSINSAVGGGNWLRTGGGVAATGCFFAAQPARSRQTTSQTFLMPSVFALSRPLVDGNLGYTPANIPWWRLAWAPSHKCFATNVDDCPSFLRRMYCLAALKAGPVPASS